LPNNAGTDPNAPIYRVVRDIVIHVVYLALSVALYFAMAESGVAVAIPVYFLVVVLIPCAFWLAIIARRRLARRAGGAERS